jgi:hypothetical protein
MDGHQLKSKIKQLATEKFGISGWAYLAYIIEVAEAYVVTRIKDKALAEETLNHIYNEYLKDLEQQ